eukprot:jgi/Tetstr1/444202/TSEL_032096.t2
MGRAPPPSGGTAAWSAEQTPRTGRAFRLYLASNAGWPPCSRDGVDGAEAGSTGSHQGSAEALGRARLRPLRVLVSADGLLATADGAGASLCGLPLPPRKTAPVQIRIDMGDIADIVCSVLSGGCMSATSMVSIKYGRGSNSLQLLSRKPRRVLAFMEEVNRVRSGRQACAAPSEASVTALGPAGAGGACGGGKADLLAKAEGRGAGIGRGGGSRSALLCSSPARSSFTGEASSGSSAPIQAAPARPVPPRAADSPSAVELSFARSRGDSAGNGRGAQSGATGSAGARPGGPLPPLVLPTVARRGSTPPETPGSLAAVTSSVGSAAAPGGDGESSVGDSPTAPAASVMRSATPPQQGGLTGCQEGAARLPGLAPSPLLGGEEGPPLEAEQSAIFGFHALGWSDDSPPLMGTLPYRSRSDADPPALRPSRLGLPNSALPSSLAAAPSPAAAQSLDFTLEQTTRPSSASGVPTTPAVSHDVALTELGKPTLLPVDGGLSPQPSGSRPGMLLLQQPPHAAAFQRYSSHRLGTDGPGAADETANTASSFVDTTHDGSSMMMYHGLVSTKTDALLSPESVLAMREAAGMGGGMAGALSELCGADDWGSDDSGSDFPRQQHWVGAAAVGASGRAARESKVWRYK